MKKLFTNKKVFIAICFIIALVSFYFGDVLAGSIMLGTPFLAELGTTTFDYTGKDNADFILRPVVSQNLFELMGFQVDYTTAETDPIYLIGANKDKILRKSRQGWVGGSFSKRSSGKITLGQMKAEFSMSVAELSGEWTRLKAANPLGINEDPTDWYKRLQGLLWSSKIGEEQVRMAFMGDTAKTFLRAGKYNGGTAYAKGDDDEYYNAHDGILKQVRASTKNVNVYHDYMIQGWDIDNQKQLFLTVSGGSVYGYATAAKRTGAVATDQLFSFPATVGTYPGLVTVTELNSSGYSGEIGLLRALTGVADFELNCPNDDMDYIAKIPMTAGRAIAQDAVKTYLKNMFAIVPPEMAKIPKSQWKIYGNRRVCMNYHDTLVGTGTYLESEKLSLQNGISTLLYDGVQMFELPVEQYIDTDFDLTAFPSNFIMLTINNNFALRIDAEGKNQKTESEYNFKDEAYLTRTKYRQGVLPIEPLYIVYADNLNA